MMEDKNISLQKLSQADLSLVESLWTNVRVRQYLGGVVPNESIPEKLNQMLNDTTAAHFSIADKKTDIHVGIISIHTYHDGMHKELSYEVLPEYWGKGIAFAGAILILNYAKKDLELTEIYAETQCANLRSRKLLEKLGMKKKAELIRFNELQAVYSMLLIS